MNSILRSAIVVAAIAGVLGGSDAFAQDDDDVYELGSKGPPAAVVIPENDPAAVAKQLGLAESAKPLSQLIPNWHKPKKIAVFVDNNTNRLAWFQEVAPGVTLVPAHNTAQLLKAVVGADAAIGKFCFKPLIQAAGPQLEYIHDYHTGVEACVAGEVPSPLRNGNIVLTNTQRVLGSSVAYHAIALMMALTRGLDIYAQQTKAGHLNPRALPPDRLWELEGRTLLVAGLGGIGTEMARYAHMLGMHVIATKNSDRNHPDFVDYVGLSDELPSLIGKADVVMSALPLTPETTNLFNAGMFAKMKRGALFINVARGREVVTADLAAALESGQVGGAGLDTTEPETEKLLASDPLWSAPNLILTPHMAGQAVESEAGVNGQLTWDVARENLRRFVNGEKVYSVVDVKRGY